MERENLCSFGQRPFYQMFKSSAWIRYTTFRWITFAALLITDRTAKLLAVLYLSETVVHGNANFFSLSLYHNHGISFSMLKNFPSVSLAASILGIVVLGIVCLKSVSLRSSTGVIFLWAGAIGNLIDRLLYGYVIDWLYVGIHINLADIWLCAGCLMIFSRYVKGTT